jgi:hypothetical protein
MKHCYYAMSVSVELTRFCCGRDSVGAGRDVLHRIILLPTSRSVEWEAWKSTIMALFWINAAEPATVQLTLSVSHDEI